MFAAQKSRLKIEGVIFPMLLKTWQQ